MPPERKGILLTAIHIDLAEPSVAFQAQGRIVGKLIFVPEGVVFDVSTEPITVGLGFARLVTELRKRKGLWMKDVAARVGVSPSTVTLWEQGRRVPRRSVRIAALAIVLDATSDECNELLQAAALHSRYKT